MVIRLVPIKPGPVVPGRRRAVHVNHVGLIVALMISPARGARALADKPPVAPNAVTYSAAALM